MKNREYQVNYETYTFNAEDDWGDYRNGISRKPCFNKHGYGFHTYFCTDGRLHTISEHIAKWEYFNGRIPKGMVIDHIIPIKNGGTNKLSNLRMVTTAENNRNEYTVKNVSEAMKKRWDDLKKVN